MGKNNITVYARNGYFDIHQCYKPEFFGASINSVIPFITEIEKTGKLWSLRNKVRCVKFMLAFYCLFFIFGVLFIIFAMTAKEKYRD